MIDFTKEEVQNLSVFIEAGARAVASQNKLLEAGSILAVAAQLQDKIQKLVQEVKAE